MTEDPQTTELWKAPLTRPVYSVHYDGITYVCYGLKAWPSYCWWIIPGMVTD